jgi:exopolyphosphatase/pppGpp-phosphohydrolase
MKLLVFDIGSNTIRTARVTPGSDGDVVVSHKRVYTTRLAEGLAASGQLSQARILQSLLVIRSVHAEATEQGFLSYAYATSAVRDAQNGSAFIGSVEAIIGHGHA